MAPNALPPYTYLWNNGVTTASQVVSPNVTTAYTVQVQDACGQQVETGVVTVGVFNVPWSVTKIGDKQTINCTSSPVTIGVQVQFNDGVWHGDISYAWSTGATTKNINVFSTVDTSYSVTITRGCTGESVVKTFDLLVYNDPVVLYTEDTDVEDIACPGDPIQIEVQASGGYPPYTYLWDNGVTTPDMMVSPFATDTFFVTVTDICGLVEYTDHVVVPVPVPSPLVIRGVGNDTLPCENLKAHFGPAVPSGGFGWGYELTWTDFESNESYMQQIINHDTSFTIKLTDGCHADTVEKTVWAVIRGHSDLKLKLTGDTTICLGDVFTLEAEGENGGGDFKYFWNGSKSSTGRFLTVNPTESTKYTVRMTDICDTARTASMSLNVSSVTSNFDFEYIDDYSVVLTDGSWSTDSIKWYEWNIPQAGVVSNEQSPQVSLPDGKTYEATLSVINEFGCIGRSVAKIMPEYHLYLPTSFTPNSDGLNETWKIESTGIRELKLEIYDRWGEKVFETTDKNFEWNGKYKGQRLPMGSYAYRIVLFTDHDEYVHKEGSLLLMNDFEEKQ
ncbi:MAG: gliding motility-associated C-terminal domain-containing protein [Flavobacteriales bacterium]